MSRHFGPALALAALSLALAAPATAADRAATGYDYRLSHAAPRHARVAHRRAHAARHHRHAHSLAPRLVYVEEPRYGLAAFLGVPESPMIYNTPYGVTRNGRTYVSVGEFRPVVLAPPVEYRPAYIAPFVPYRR